MTRGRFLPTLLTAVALLVAGPAGAAGAGSPGSDTGDEVPRSGTRVATVDPAHLFDWDPLRLIAVDAVQSHSLGVDVIAVWTCNAPGTPALDAARMVADLNRLGVVEYFRWWSSGRYEPRFVTGGSITEGDRDRCRSTVLDGPSSANAGLIVMNRASDGRASPGRFACASSPLDCDLDDGFPLNGRYAQVGSTFAYGPGGGLASPGPLIHEIGHLLAWPHSFSGRGSEYDNPIDVMSGIEARGTLAVNRYAAGWIDPGAVRVADPVAATVPVGAHGAGGKELLVLPTGDPGRFHTVEVRLPGLHEAMPASLGGVYLHTVDQRNQACIRPPIAGLPCFGVARRTTPAVGSGSGHRLLVGNTVTLAGGGGLTWTVRVVSRRGDTYTIAVAARGVPTCAGRTATRLGTTGPDTIVGTRGADVIVGLGGDDRILGRGGDDIICGGDGDDLLRGGHGADRLDGGAGEDRVVGGGDDDVLIGCPGEDTLSGRGGDDILNGDGASAWSGADDLLRGGGGDDTVNGGGGDDRIDGGPGDDTLGGGHGDDLLRGRPGSDRLSGGKGQDLLKGGPGADHLAGMGDSDVLIGGPDGDDLDGGGDQDELRGQSGDDRLDGGGGADTLRGGAGEDACSAESQTVGCEFPL